MTVGAVLPSVGAVGIVGQLITGGSLRPLHWLRFVALEYWSGHRDPAPALFLVLQCILVQQTPKSSMCFELSSGHQLIAEPAHPKVVTGSSWLMGGISLCCVLSPCILLTEVYLVNLAS